MLIDDLPPDMPPAEKRRLRMLEGYKLRRNPTPKTLLASENARKAKREWTMSERAQSRRK